MYNLLERLCEHICWVVGPGDVVYINDFVIYTFTDEVCMYINVFHAGVRVRVMCA